eukprot:CAMPEP_0171467284 /NCGR_PEP_ID=MMETSP0945-20130129/9857_1 /TAXON_ID=109269 /ORGANISM="Vaucheria litorea, Strain CCMP2940" /LENGTH=125 /DNA_ID=CAMNT_0011995727 /DNA_START=186 /DNA_END=560 /DNA_ORIENTATION=-
MDHMEFLRDKKLEADIDEVLCKIVMMGKEESSIMCSAEFRKNRIGYDRLLPVLLDPRWSKDLLVMRDQRRHLIDRMLSDQNYHCTHFFIKLPFGSESDECCAADLKIQTKFGEFRAHSFLLSARS